MNDDYTQGTPRVPGNQDLNSDILDTGDLDVDLPIEPYPSQSMQNLQKRVVSLPVEANDNDLIEKEWITVLQEIVHHTSEDPHSQQNEISKIKADYMKKRYNKDVKQGG